MRKSKQIKYNIKAPSFHIFPPDMNPFLRKHLALSWAFPPKIRDLKKKKHCKCYIESSIQYVKCSRFTLKCDV